jgi:hypothetical protein
VERLFEQANEPLEFHNFLEIPEYLTVQLAASQEGVSYMEVISVRVTKWLIAVCF